MKKLLFLFIIIPVISLSQVWNQVSSFIDDGRHHPITFANDNFGYVMSGSYLNDAYKYDKSTDSWSQLQNVPFTGRGYSYGVALADIAYMGFGSTSSGSYPTDWWQYNMNTDSWTQLANFPGDGRNHPAMIITNNKIYVGCGSNGNGNLNDWWEYDILSNSWQQKSDLTANQRHHPFYFGIGNYAYVGFGHGSLPGPGSNPSSNSYIYNDFYRYDPTNDSWLQLADFPSEARVAGTQFSYNGKGYILSGDGDDHGPLSSGEFWEYNPSNDSWNQLTSHPGGAIWAPGNFVIGCDVYFMLGQDWNNNIGLYPLSVYRYKLSNDCGCTDMLAFNYSSLALYDDGSCCYVSGCTDPISLNYDSTACYDDGSCIMPIIGCNDTTAVNFDPNANTTFAFGGALDNTIGNGNYFNGNQHLIFNSYKQCIIKSAIIDSESSNTITFELRDSGGVVIDDTTLTISAGIQKVNLNFNVPVGNDLQLGVSNNSLQTNGLYRNSTGANYPYNIGAAISITQSSASTNPFDYYYFFYNIEVEIKCVSYPDSWDCDSQGNCFDPGTGNGQYNSLISCQNNCIKPSWDCDSQGNCFDPGTGNGQYNNLVSCESECLNVSIIEKKLDGFKIYPNPSDNLFNIEFISEELHDVELRISNSVGKVIYHDFKNNHIGKFSKSIKTDRLPKGIYLMVIKTNKMVINKKLILH